MNLTFRSAGVVLAASAALVAAAGCIGGSTTVTGEINDDAITLSTDHAGSNVKFHLTNIGTLPCDLIVAIGSMAHLGEVAEVGDPVPDGRLGKRYRHRPNGRQAERPAGRLDGEGCRLLGEGGVHDAASPRSAS